MSTAVLRAPAKLTLSLRVLGTRDDGMHLIDAEMVSLDLSDKLRVSSTGDDDPGPDISSPGGRASSVAYVGPAAPDGADALASGDDLVTRALELAGRDASVEVVKRIPLGAGLGGGSADAAAILRWAGITDVARAVELGADCAFCLVGGRARVTGIGETVESLPFRPQEFTLLTPPVHCSTADVYRAWDELGGPTHESGNDLLPAALAVAPELDRYRSELRDATGDEPRLAGSGSTWFVEGAHPGPDRVVVSTLPAE